MPADEGNVEAALRALLAWTEASLGGTTLYLNDPVFVNARAALRSRGSSEDAALCGSFGCTLPAGHNRGRADVPENHLLPERGSSDTRLTEALADLYEWSKDYDAFTPAQNRAAAALAAARADAPQACKTYVAEVAAWEAQGGLTYGPPPVPDSDRSPCDDPACPRCNPAPSSDVSGKQA